MSEAMKQSDIREGYKVVNIGPKSFEIPEEWSVDTIPDLCNLDTETFDGSSHSGETFEYIDIESVSRGTIDRSKTIPVEDAPSRAKQLVNAGDTLVGKVRPYLQAFAPVTEEHDGKVCSTGFAVLSAKDNVSSSYITQAVLSKYFLDQMTNRMTGTSYPAVNKSDFQNVRLFTPPLHEQRRIADILSTVDKQIQQTNEIIEKTHELKRGLMQNLFLRGISHRSFNQESIGPRTIQIPEGWELYSVEDLLAKTDKKALRGGPPGSRIKKEDRAKSGPKIYVQETVIHSDFSMGSEYITEEKFKELKPAEVDPGDVLVTRSGTVGRSEVFPEDAPRGILGSSLIRIKVKPDLCLPKYLSQYIANAPIAKFQINSMSHGGTRVGLNNKIVKAIQVPVPPIEEQNKIVGVLSKVDERIENEQLTKECLQELKRGLMQDLLTGKVRVNPETTD